MGVCEASALLERGADVVIPSAATRFHGVEHFACFYERVRDFIRGRTASFECVSLTLCAALICSKLGDEFVKVLMTKLISVVEHYF